jgi:hypothetical protein
MILLQVDAPRVTIPPFKGNAPRTIDVKGIALRLATQGMKVEAWNVKIGKVLRTVQRTQPGSTPPYEVAPDPARVVLQEQATQPL